MDSLKKATRRAVKVGFGSLIPESAETRGHGTTSMAKFYKKDLEALLQQAKRRELGK